MLHEIANQFQTPPSLQLDADAQRGMAEAEALIGRDVQRGLAEVRRLRAEALACYRISNALDESTQPTTTVDAAEAASDEAGERHYYALAYVLSLPIRSVADVRDKAFLSMEEKTIVRDDLDIETAVLTQIAAFFAGMDEAAIPVS